MTPSAAHQLSDAVLANVISWNDALGLAIKISAEDDIVFDIADIIWDRAQERHQLEKDMLS